jgi:F420-dependent oxidoreductase-like protein
VVEGWHGQAYGKPLGKTREYVQIVRTILQREKPLAHTGAHYQIPYQGPDASGLGKPLKSIIHGRADLPIYLAAIGPKNIELAAEIADGWLPVFFSPRHYDSVFRPHIEAGLAKAGGSKNFAIVPSVPIVMGDDVEFCRMLIKPFVALYIGGMGAKGANFYADLAGRYGYAEAAAQIQDLYLAGKKNDAIAVVPDELVDDIALCGPRERIAEQLALWKSVPVTTLNLTVQALSVEILEEMMALAA